ncbi:D-alanyl-D-alanine carboxypeptidase family protein [Streptomyces tropicalis]|uniref:Serine hydrolase n=1 Tax=Streptomyces tropicalis TaxID=3034234 RepID=A0ABT5ZXZ3_9ACTN|nr:serine hydrolase [Streptomyces tropicalis]MDF3297267.1 serine hydrolase [Streptomyces tropicalis]
MRHSSPPIRGAAAGPSRRSLLAATAAVPLAVAGAAPAAAASPVVGGERLARDGVQAEGAVGLPKNLTARSWLVADGTTGEVLAAYRAHHRLPPASTLKMLFAGTVLKKFSREERHTVTPADLADIPEGSSLVGIQAGTTYTVEQLWQGVFLRSGNDAVHVLAHMNGGVGRTVAEMQALATDLQALDTHVVSPDGFDHPGQTSSAYDLTLFARHGLKNADFRSYCGTRTADFPAGGHRTFQIQNTDRLLTGAWGLRTYPGLVGVKNGYTSNAGNTFTGAATRDGRTLLVTVMHPGIGGNAVYEETAALLDWGFAHGASARPVGTLARPLSEGGSRAGAAGPARRAQTAAGAAGVPGKPSGWRLLEGAGGTVALLAGGVWALRRRRREAPAGDESGRRPRTVPAREESGGRRRRAVPAGEESGGRRRRAVPGGEEPGGRRRPTVRVADESGGRHRR